MQGDELWLFEVLHAYAAAVQHQHQSRLSTFLHRGDVVGRAHQHLRHFIATLIAEGVAAGGLYLSMRSPTSSYTESVGRPRSRRRQQRFDLVDLTINGLRRSPP